jgi:hypothetical protein
MLEEELIITNGKKRLAIDSEDLERLKSGKDIVGKSLEHTGQEEWISSKDNWEVEKSLEEDEYDFNVNKVWDFIESRPFNNKDYMPLFYTAKEIWDSWGDEEKEMYSNFKWDDKYGDNLHHREKANIQRKENYNRLKLKENGDKKKNPPLGKPKRGGSKKFYVYVRDPKTKKIKKVSFGDTTGLSAKINNPEARRAFAKRHDCANKKDKTKASYWSCRLPRYAKLLGLKSSFSGFW